MGDKKKKGMNPNWFLVIGICILIIPAAIYLGFLIPRMKDEYIALMSSGSGLGGAGAFGTYMIPETAKFGTLYKTASKSITMLVVITLVKDFIGQLLGLALVFIISYIVFLIMRSRWKDGKRKRENADIANSVSQGVIEALK